MTSIKYLGLLSLLLAQSGCTDKKEISPVNESKVIPAPSAKDETQSPSNQQNPVVPGNLEEGMK